MDRFKPHWRAKAKVKHRATYYLGNWKHNNSHIISCLNFFTQYTITQEARDKSRVLFIYVIYLCSSLRWSELFCVPSSVLVLMIIYLQQNIDFLFVCWNFIILCSVLVVFIMAISCEWWSGHAVNCFATSGLIGSILNWSTVLLSDCCVWYWIIPNRRSCTDQKPPLTYYDDTWTKPWDSTSRIHILMAVAYVSFWYHDNDIPCGHNAISACGFLQVADDENGVSIEYMYMY